VTAARAPIGIAGLTAALVSCAALQGGFYLGQATLALVLVVAAVACTGFRTALPAASWIGLGLLAAGLGASALANGVSGSSLKPFATLALAAGIAELAARTARAAGVRAVHDIIVFLAATVGMLGIVGVAFHIEPLALPADPWRLQSTLTYQNAAASLMVLALPAGMLAVLSRRPGARAALVIIGAALASTVSRGGLLAALIATIVVLLRAQHPRGSLLDPLAGAVVAAVALLPSMLNARLGWAIALIGVALGVVTAALAESSRLMRRVARGAAVIAIIAAGVAIPATALGGRVTVSSMDRGRVWSETWSQVDERPWFGTGPGTYRLEAAKGDELVTTRFAHNEYLQTLSETGIVGLSSVVAAIAFFAGSAYRARRAIGADGFTVILASGVAFLAHSAVDFLWRIPLLVCVLFALYGATVTAIRRDRDPSRPAEADTATR
jgi:O-antigen ligase